MVVDIHYIHQDSLIKKYVIGTKTDSEYLLFGLYSFLCLKLNVNVFQYSLVSTVASLSFYRRINLNIFNLWAHYLLMEFLKHVSLEMRLEGAGNLDACMIFDKINRNKPIVQVVIRFFSLISHDSSIHRAL